MERRASTCCDPRRTVRVKMVVRARACVATGTPLSTGPMPPSMPALSPLNTAVSWVLSPTWTAVAAAVKLSIVGEGGEGEPGTSLDDEDPQAAARSEQKASAAPPRGRFESPEIHRRRRPEAAGHRLRAVLARIVSTQGPVPQRMSRAALALSLGACSSMLFMVERTPVR